MVHYPSSRLLLSVQHPPSSSSASEPPVPGYSDIEIILTCLLCSIICVLGLMALFRWTCFKSSSTVSTTTDEAFPTECCKKVVDALPRLIFKSAADVTVSVAATSAAECVICLSEFLDGQEIRVLPKCAHVFHVGCIDKWLIGSHSFCCPCCRQDLAVRQCQKSKSGVSVPSASPSPQLEPDFLP